jgi:hypothetical protein
MVLFSTPLREGAHHASARFGPSPLHVKDAQTDKHSRALCLASVGMSNGLHAEDKAYGNASIKSGIIIEEQLSQTLRPLIKEKKKEPHPHLTSKSLQITNCCVHATRCGSQVHGTASFSLLSDDMSSDRS